MITIQSIIALFWPFYQLSELALGLPFRFYVLDLIYVISFIILVPNIFKSTKEIKKPLLIFLSTATITLLTSKIFTPSLTWTQLLLSSLYLFRLILYIPLLFISPKTKPYFIFSLCIFPLIGLIQYLAAPDLRFLKSINFDDHLYRLTFPFLDPNFTGAVLAFIIFYLFRLRQSLLSRIIIPITLISLALTFSRSAFLSFTIAAIFVSLKSRFANLRISPILAITLILFILLLLSPKPFGEGVNLTRTFSITSRMTNISEALSQFSRSPVLGLGFNTLRYQGAIELNSRASGGVSNSIVFVLVTTGIVGLVTFLNLIRSVYRIISRDIYLCAAFMVLFISSLFNNTLFYSPIIVLMFLTLAYETNESI